MKILLAGGGTLGPVTPLLALVEAWRARDADVEFVFVGTPSGPERALVVEQYHLVFLSLLPVRFPRSFSLEWLFLPFRIVFVLCQSWRLLRREKPDVIVGAGGFTQVPLVMVGWALGIPSVVLQTDVSPLLSTRLSAPFVSQIVTAWEETARAFPSHKIRVLGVPVRASIKTGLRERAIERFNLDPEKHTLLVFGGGTGSLWINERMAEILPALTEEMNVVLITGKGKMEKGQEWQKGHSQIFPEPVGGMFGAVVGRYTAVEYLDTGMENLYAAADLVLCRAGLGTISELTALSKPAIIIPLPHSAQEINARLLQDQGAALVLPQSQTTAEELLAEIRLLMQDDTRREKYREQITHVLKTDVADEIIQTIEVIAKT